MPSVDFDLKDERTAALFGLSPEGDRDRSGSDSLLASGVVALVMCRESGTLPELLEGLIEQTLAHFGSDLPGSSLLREAGYRAYSEPESLPEDVDWARFRYGRARATVLRHGSVLYLYSMSSAAKLNEAGRNDFSELFYRILEATRPRDIVVSTFSRLVRSLSHSPRLQDVVQRHCSRVRTIQQDIDISSPMGQLLWQVFAMLAASERDAIVQRLFHGRLMMWKRGNWPLGKGRAIPLGYRLVDKVLEVDPAQTQLLNDVLEVMADESLSDVDAAHRIRRLRIGQVRNAASGITEDEEEEDSRSPQMLLRPLLGWLDLYLSGEYLFPITLPYDGLEEFQGIPVEVCEMADGQSRSLIRLPYRPGRPDVDRELVARARSVRQPQRGDALPPAAPLMSRAWTDGDSTTVLRRSHRDRYAIVKRSGALRDGPKASTLGPANGRTIGTVSMDDLHRSIVNSIADGLSSGVLAERLELRSRVAVLTGTTRVDRLSARMEVLTEQKERTLREIEGALRAAARAEDEANVDALLERASDLRRDLRKIEAGIEDLDRERSAPPPPLESFETDADLILSALSVLTSNKPLASRETRVALAQVLTDFRLDVNDDVVDWQAFLMLPHDEYEVRLGPFVGRVARQGRVLPEALVDDPTLDASVGDRVATYEMGLRERGLSHLAAKCAARAPQELLPRILLGEDVRWPGCDAAFDHDDFNAYLRQCWTDPAWSGRQYARTHRPRQLLTDIVAGAGGRLDLAQVLEVGEPYGLKYQQVHYMTRGSNDVNDVTREWCPPVLREGKWDCRSPQSEHYLVSRRCWSCGEPATAVVRVLEVPGDLMCRTCCVAIDLPGRVFPPIYLGLALPPSF